MSYAVIMLCFFFLQLHAFWWLVSLAWSKSQLKKRVLEAAKLAYANKTYALETWWIANSFLNKVKSALPSLFNSPGFDIGKLFKIFLRALILMTWVSLYLFFFLELMWNCIIFMELSRGLKRSWLNSSGGSKILWAWTFIRTSQTLQYVSERFLFFRMLDVS